jgi:hypothetical protein
MTGKHCRQHMYSPSGSLQSAARAEVCSLVFSLQ